MAAGRPKLKAKPAVDLFLSRFAEGEWRGVIRPWLEAGSGRLERALVVAPTRGHTHALKRRCLAEDVPLLGVEFLTPGLARKKRASADGLGRGLQLLYLRTRIEARLARLGPDDPARGFWKSLGSDLESALSDFEELMRGGFRPERFPRQELREIFGELVAWIGEKGYALAPLQDEAAALEPPEAGSACVAGRILILAGGPEGWGDFFGLAALARRCASLTVVLAEPEFKGSGGSDEKWIDAWQAFLGVEGRLVDAVDPDASCGAVAELWTSGVGDAGRAEVLVGRSRSEEMARVADALERLLAEGADNIGVIFPGAGAAHTRLMRLLDERGVPFADLIGTAGTPPVDTRIQRGLVDFYERGCRLEELLALWPLLRSLGFARLGPAEARAACQWLFDEVQSHGVEAHVDKLEGSAEAGKREVARVARLLLPGWPETLAPIEALARFEAVRDRLMLGAPPGWSAFREFAGRVEEPMPSRALLEAIRAFLPEKGPLEGVPGRSGFARVTLTTCRRAAGVAWSDSIFVEANAGIWPERREPSCWLGDEARRELNASGRFSLGVPTSDERALLERRLFSAIARDTRRRVVFSAALFSEEEPEVALGPNAWLERVLWSKGLISSSDGASESFGPLSGAASTVAAPAAAPSADLAGWFDIWRRRRDPAAPFDAFFLADPSGQSRPLRLSASQIERGIKDPACLWFGSILGLQRAGWGTFSRARGKSIGTAVHRALAAALRGAPFEGDFFLMADRATAGARLESQLAQLRARWPSDRYWDSFHMDVCRGARELAKRVYELPQASYGAVEVRVPEGASVPLGEADRLFVSGRMDLVLSDRPGWAGAHVEIVDFKTGEASKLSARRMESSGSSLQLGVYLEAALSVGSTGTVWMLKPEDRPMKLGAHELARASGKLRVLGAHLATGIYGARTPDRDEYTRGFEWPLACAPIGAVTLESKFVATFGPSAASAAGEDDDE
jgi:RecB family exonuclease